MKLRGEKEGVEVKGLVASPLAMLQVEPFVGPIELWTKWTSEQLTIDAAVRIEKHRWLRKFDTEKSPLEEIPLSDAERPLDENRPLPRLGCNVELTEVKLWNEKWWTFGFEAFGRIETVENSLRSVALALSARKPPPFGAIAETSSQTWRDKDGVLASYPLWLSEMLRAVHTGT